MHDFGHPLRLGLEPLALDGWLVPQPGDNDMLAERRRIISLHHDRVIAALPAAEAAVTELCDLLIARRRITVAAGGAVARLEAIGQQVAEDLCVLTADAAGRLILTAGVVCFPNRWRLADKIGAGMIATHAPVPGYEHTVGNAVDRFLARLHPLRAFRRSNWGVTATTALFTPDPTPPVDAVGAGPVDAVFVRREDQSFLKLPATGAVIFSIRTSFTAVAALSATERLALADSVKNLDPAWHAYKALSLGII